MGIRSLAQDMHWPLKLRVHSDATAAIGIAKRRGLGKLRHSHTMDLWVQEKTRNGDVELLNILGSENRADIFTKYVDRGILDAALLKINCFVMDGRAKCAPASAGPKEPKPSTPEGKEGGRDTLGGTSMLAPAKAN